MKFIIRHIRNGYIKFDAEDGNLTFTANIDRARTFSTKSAAEEFATDNEFATEATIIAADQTESGPDLYL